MTCESQSLALELEGAAAASRERGHLNSDVRERMLKLAERLYTGGALSSAYIHRRFGVSKATAKRDLTVLEQILPCRVDLEPGFAFHGRGPRVKILRLATPTVDHAARLKQHERALDAPGEGIVTWP